MAVLSVTAASVLMSSSASFLSNHTAAVAITAGQAVYLNSSNAWALLDTNAAATGNGINDVRGIAVDSAPGAGQPITVCMKDPGFTPGATMTVGKVIYGSITAGGITLAEIPGTGEYPVVLGIAITATVMNLDICASGAVAA